MQCGTIEYPSQVPPYPPLRKQRQSKNLLQRQSNVDCVKAKMVFQVLERKYISYEKLIAKLAELFPNDSTVKAEVSRSPYATPRLRPG